MGSPAQVAALQSAKTISSSAPPHPLTSDAANSPLEDATFDHRFHDSHEFVVSIEKISNLSVVEGRSWGEGDCFLKYSFPTQTANSFVDASAQQGGNHLFPPAIALKSYQTPTVPYVPDPVIGYSTKHSIVLPSPSSGASGVPNVDSSTISIHRQLLRATSSSKHSIPIELWTRFYAPSVDDKLIAKGFLSLEELRRDALNGEGGDARFKVKLMRVNSAVGSEGMEDSASLVGVVNVGVSYLRHRVDMLTPASTEENAALASLNQYEVENRVVPLAVVLHKACGLKTLAKVSC